MCRGRHVPNVPPTAAVPPSNASPILKPDSLSTALSVPVTSEAPPAHLARAIDPAVSVLATPLNPLTTDLDVVTTQWIETWIGGTSRTWVPRTITLHFKPHITQAPLPGQGEIGMGTLSGKTGNTQTVVVLAGGAPGRAVGWMGGVVGLGLGWGMGFGLVGLVG